MIDRDFTMAAKFQAGTRGRDEDTGMPALFVPLDPEDYRGADLPVVKKKPLTFTDRVKVQPLLTPDNYGEFVLKLIEGAKRKLYFINQSLSVRSFQPDDTTVFGRLVLALLKKANELKEVKVILRDISGVDQDLSALKRLGFPMEKVKVQPALHTKGIVVDGKRVLVGSQNWSFQGVDANRDASLLFDNAQDRGVLRGQLPARLGTAGAHEGDVTDEPAAGAARHRGPVGRGGRRRGGELERLLRRVSAAVPRRHAPGGRVKRTARPVVRR